MSDDLPSSSVWPTYACSFQIWTVFRDGINENVQFVCSRLQYTGSINTYCLKWYGLLGEIDKLCSICWSEPLKTVAWCLLLSHSVFYNARLSVVNVTQMCLETPVMCNNCKPFYLLPALINRSSSQRNSCECLGGGLSGKETSGNSSHTLTLVLHLLHSSTWFPFPHKHSTCVTSNHWAQQKILIKEFNWCERFTWSTWGCASLLLNDTGVFRKPSTSAV